MNRVLNNYDDFFSIFYSKSVNYCDTKKRKSTLSEESVVLPKKHKPEVKLSCPETPSFVRYESQGNDFFNLVMESQGNRGMSGSLGNFE